MEGIARSLGPHSEIVLHSLGDLAHSVVQIKNGYVTGREVGAPITNLALNVLAQALETHQDVIGPYRSTTANGRTVKSVTTLLPSASSASMSISMSAWWTLSGTFPPSTTSPGRPLRSTPWNCRT